jgi:outer membrane receptor protein involved in Fe transport
MKKLLCLLFVGVLLFASDYGRISGRVTDEETGEALIGADVYLQGTELGAATDVSGEYSILYVPVGTYQVVAAYVGYNEFTYTKVVVNADQTTVLNFKLPPTVITVGEVVSVAERPMIVISETSTGRAVTSQEMGRLPVTTINQVITLQAGVVESDLGTHVRGGRADEITYFVDGIVTKVPNTGWQSVRINPSAVEEVSVVSGGFDAEYGDALSGIINIHTKEGGTKHSGTFRFLTDEVFGSGNDKLNFGYNLYDFSLGGPIPVSRRLRYFVSGEVMMTDAYQDALYKIESPRMDYRGQARFSYLFPNAKGKVTFSGFTSREQFVYWSTSGIDPNSLKFFDQKPISRTKNWIASATFNYMLTAKTLTSLKVGATHFDRVYGNRDYVWEEANDRQWYDDYRFYGEHLVDYLVTGELPVRDVLIDSVMAYHEEYLNRGPFALRNSPYAIEGYFRTYGDYRVWRAWRNDDYQGRFDLTHSIGKVHEFKTGMDFIQYKIQYFDNNLPWVTNPFWDYYDRDPYKFAFYIQDKMDFEGLIARLGVRFDYFDPKSFTFANPQDYTDSSIVDAETNYKISPRLGFSLPVTDRMKFRFNYGQYFQLPQLDDMYATNDTAIIRLALSRGNTIVGNILMKPQKTVMYEVGIENQISEEIAFGFTAYFKDIYDLSQIREVQALPMSYYQFFNVDYGNVKGFEFNIKKRMSDMWALAIVYTLQFARGTGAWAGEWYYDHYDFNIDPPVIDYWLDFDERHTVNANFDIDLPSNFFLIPLQNFASSFVLSYHSGHPYTPEDLKGNKLGDENSARMPGYLNVDWSFSRRVKLGPANVILSGLIENLFNTEQVTNVYVTTGVADDHGDEEPTITQFVPISMTSDRYSPQGDFNHDGLIDPAEGKLDYMNALTEYYTNPRNYNNAFKVRFGVGIGF